MIILEAGIRSSGVLLPERRLLCRRKLFPGSRTHGVDHVVVDVPRDRQMLLA